MGIWLDLQCKALQPSLTMADQAPSTADIPTEGAWYVIDEGEIEQGTAAPQEGDAWAFSHTSSEEEWRKKMGEHATRCYESCQSIYRVKRSHGALYHLGRGGTVRSRF